jgi:hypothetical protein
MPSPFPGMDPYLEPHWLDVHTAIVAEARGTLNRLLPPGQVARAEERLAIESDEQLFRRMGPDVRVFSPSTADPSEGAGGVVIEAPFKLVLELDPIIERYVRIVDEAGQLITVVEFISPTNKRQPGLDDYREKRAALLTAGVHVVEIDLVRAGNWRALMRPEVCPPNAITPYRVTVRASGTRPGAYLFPIWLRLPLPEIQIPLRPIDQPVRLALQPLLDAVYDGGRYGQTINYRLSLDEPLEGEDESWADSLLRTSGRR